MERLREWDSDYQEVSHLKQSRIALYVKERFLMIIIIEEDENKARRAL